MSLEWGEGAMMLMSWREGGFCASSLKASMWLFF